MSTQRSILSFFGKSSNTAKKANISEKRPSASTTSSDNVSTTAEDSIDAPRVKRRRPPVIEDIDMEDDEIGVPDLAIEENKPPAKVPTTMSPIQNRFRDISISTKKTSPFGTRTSPTVSDTSTSKKNESSIKRPVGSKASSGKPGDQERYPWLVDIRDKNGLSPGEEDYDPTTLYIPPEAFNSLTAFEKQYWEIKSQYFDSVVFFKKGKFFELYENDADIGCKVFDLKVSDRVNMRMAGVPEAGIGEWMSRFVAKGLKVVRVDQEENAIGREMRGRESNSKEDKIIRRCVTAIYTSGTLVDPNMIIGDDAIYCLAIKEYSAANGDVDFGICFVDAATSEFNLCHITNDRGRTKLGTLLHQIQPKEVIFERGLISAETVQLVKSKVHLDSINYLKPDAEFWDAKTTQDEIHVNEYFPDGYPDALESMRHQEIVMSAFGAMVSYLKQLKQDRQLLTARNFRVYDPIFGNASSLILDGQTLANLEILRNSVDDSTEGTLLQLLSKCKTGFGKRLFKRWLCHPLRQIEQINARLDAVEDFMHEKELVGRLEKKLASIPDLERLISCIHSKKVSAKDFSRVLDGFRMTGEIVELLAQHGESFKSSNIQKIIASFPKVHHMIEQIDALFSVEEGVHVDYTKGTALIPAPGNIEWERINDDILNLEAEFNEYLQQKKKELKQNVNKEVYLIEAPRSVRCPHSWIQASATSSVVRYLSPELKHKIKSYLHLRETKAAFIRAFALEIYEQFDQYYKEWCRAVKLIAELDCLISLANASRDLGDVSCRPIFIDQENSVIDIQQMRHPCIRPSAGQDFIPNNLKLGDDTSSIGILTGPNMGGKSTLLRQTCIAVIMAQLGCYVPAEQCILTPCDQIFTRIGANDNIMGGQSTFMVELAETSKILRDATPRSLVILDELGRGTSTFDGYAIAYAVLHYLATHIGCMSLFSTHYHTLCQEFSRHPGVKNMHMNYMVDEKDNTVTFLYELVPGICNKSFGMNVARIADVPEEVITKASIKAKEFERTHRTMDSGVTEDMDVDGAEKCIGFTPAVLSDLGDILSGKMNDKTLVRLVRGL
ncbi:muts domain V-domain-containing protein [Dichotomocladium elegans]|nr:muts domain V-domain-containing protein [Dichotomocladium elegans]